VDLNLLAEFISWLRSPDQSTKVVHLMQIKAKRSERTVNTILTCVQGFYDYLVRNEEYEEDLKLPFKSIVKNLGNFIFLTNVLDRISGTKVIKVLTSK
jgi:integrase/recombinase XerD